MPITQNQLKKLVDYKDGNLYWRESGSGRKMGVPAGIINGSGYRQIMINYKLYLTHQLIYLYHYGYIPKCLDHIDSNPSNNDINNIRESTVSQNAMNKRKAKVINGKSPSSQFKGVSWHKQAKKWNPQIKIDGKKKNLGSFNSEIEAAKAYDKVAIELFGEFVKTNAMMFPEISKLRSNL